MSVTYSGVSQSLNATRVLYYSEDTVKALAQAAMVSMAEANTEMVCDMGEEYKTKADVERVFEGLHDQASDMIDDMFDDLKERLIKELSTKKYTARVKAMHYNEAGQLDDVDVNIVFE